MNVRNLLICTSLAALFCITTIVPEPPKHRKLVGTQERIARIIYGIAATEFAMLSVSVLSLAIGELLEVETNDGKDNATYKQDYISKLCSKPLHWWWHAHCLALRPIRKILGGDPWTAGFLLGGGYITYRIAKFFAYKALSDDEPEKDDIEFEYY